MRRRDVLRLMLAAGAATLPAGLAGAADAQGLRRRPIPGSGEALPAVGLGTWQTFSLRDRAASRAVLGRFVELGGTVVDTSPMYGQAEEAIGAIGDELGVLERLFLATKVWTTGERRGREQMRRSAQLMNASPLDLIQVHNLQDWRTHLRTLREMKDSGQVRYVGITHYTVGAHAELERIVRSEPVDFVQVNYNIAVRDAERSLLPAAADHGVAVIINRPYAEGALFARVRGETLPPWAADLECRSFAQIFLKFILSNQAVTCVIPATSRIDHLEDNMGAARGPLPDPALRRRMVDWFAGL